MARDVSTPIESTWSRWRRAALGLVAALLASGLLDAGADACGFPPDTLPPGSYRASCSDCSADGGILVCDCLTIGQVLNRTSLDITNCATDPANTNGVLVCDPCTTPSFGACCLGGVSCAELFASECSELGGDFQGDDSLCEAVECPGGCESDPLTVAWVGGRAGAFDDSANWDPPQVPFSDGATRCDEILIEGGRGIVIDLGATAAASLAATAPEPVRRAWRYEAVGAVALRPVDGTLEVQCPSQILGERSVELAGASLLLDGGAVLAQSAAVGTAGEGAIEVVGTRGLFIAEGRLGVGAGAPGSLLARDGTTVITGDAVLGETEARGTAIVRGDATTWFSGDLTVGGEAEGTLTIEAGGQVTSEAGWIGLELDGDERASVEVRGATPAGTPSQWNLSSNLEVLPRGSLYVADRGVVRVSGALTIGEPGGATDCDTGLACVDVFDGLLSAHGVLVGNNGGGTLKIGSSGVVAATGQFAIGTSSHFSEVLIEGPSESASLFSNLAIATDPGATGKLRIGVGGQLDLLGRFRVGGGGGGGLGTFQILGDAADPAGVTRVSALDGSGLDSVVGGPAQLAPNHYGGELQIESATLELSGAGHDLVIERNGFVSGGLAVIAFEAGGKLVHKGALVGGGFIIQGDYVSEPTAFLNAAVSEVPAAPSPQGLRALAAAPPPPPFQPLVVTGDATLAGKAVLQFGNGAAPKQGDAFELLQVEGEVTGAFDEVEVKGLVPGTFDFAASSESGLVLTSLTDAEPLPHVNLAGKPSLLESKKAAKLKLTRSGDTSAPLTVSYTVGGSAESGVDYAALPGTIQFPARKKSVTLLVQPIADGLAEGSETIEIALAPDASFAPGLVSELTLELRDAKTK